MSEEEEDVYWFCYSFYRTIAAGHVKFVPDKNHTHTYELCMQELFRSVVSNTATVRKFAFSP
jgi:hypothetical protein